MSLVKLIRAMPMWLETALVVAIAFGYFVFAAIETWLGGKAGSSDVMAFDTETLAFIVSYELAVAPLLIGFLWVRGWRPADIHLAPSWGGTGYGLLLYVTAVVLALALGLAHQVVGIDATGSNGVAETSVTVAPSMILFGSLVNGAYEEIFVCGYLIAAMSRWTSLRTAIATSVGLRVVYHLYQGTGAIIFHASFGWLFAWVFLRRRDLWPLIFAHAIWDIVALAAHSAYGEPARAVLR